VISLWYLTYEVLFTNIRLDSEAELKKATIDMTLFEEIMQNKTYSELLSKLPDDEKPLILDSLKKFVDTFETKVLHPINSSSHKPIL